MKRARLLIFLMVLAVMAAVGLFILRSLKSDRLVLPGGMTLTLEAVQTGPFTNAPLAGESLLTGLIRKLPKPIASLLLPQGSGNRSAGRSYYTDAFQDKSLHLWFSLLKDGKPVDAARFRDDLFLVDDRGWLYPSYGWAHQGSGRYAQPELNCYSFSVLPRWQKSLDVVIRHESTDGPLDPLTILNPAYLPGPETNWSARPVPQERLIDSVVFRLAEFRQDKPMYWGRKFHGTNLRAPARWNTLLQSREPDGATNVWHVIRTSYFDNYGNHSLEGLPPRLGADDGLEGLQWKIQCVVCADERSVTASNYFWELPTLTIPGPGEAEVLNRTNIDWGALRIQFGALAGSGETVYTNGVWQETTTSPTPVNSDGWSSSSRGSGSNYVETVRLTRSKPHLAFCPSGAYTNYYYTCRAIDTVTGAKVWLGKNRPSKDEPVFQRKYNSYETVSFNCGSLAYSHPYKFVLGAHPHRLVEFFVDAPIEKRQPENGSGDKP